MPLAPILGCFSTPPSYPSRCTRTAKHTRYFRFRTAFENGVPVSDVLVNEHGRNAATAAAASGLFAYRIMIEDLGDLIDSQRVARETMRESSLERKFDDEYHTLDEIWAQMQTLANAHDIASYVDSIGTSHQGRKIPVLRFGGSQSTLSFWIQGGMHAREWISPATVMSVVEQLLTSTDPAIQALLQQIEFVVAGGAFHPTMS